MKITEFDQEKMDLVLEQIKNSEAVVTFFRIPSEGNKLLFSGFSEIEFNMIVNLLHRHIEFFEIIKLAILSSEKLRNDIQEGVCFIKEAIEYIKLSRGKIK